MLPGSPSPQHPCSPAPLLFLKLGGSLITAKSSPHTPRPDVINRLAQEIASALQEDPSQRLLLGHGSGSFGHIPARKYGTRQGVHTPEEWRGFAEVWAEASALNRLVMEALHAAGLPALAFPPSASVVATDGRVESWNLAPLQNALDMGLLPVIYGDVVFDAARGGTILSTEDLFGYLAPRLHPARILLAGLEQGVWVDFPACTRLIREITPSSFPSVLPSLSGSASADVTGGMESKVRQSLAWVEEVAGVEVVIFSGEVPGALLRTLRGGTPGTVISKG